MKKKRSPEQIDFDFLDTTGAADLPWEEFLKVLDRVSPKLIHDESLPSQPR